MPIQPASSHSSANPSDASADWELPARVPPGVVPGLERYLGLVCGRAPGLLAGFYLIGSIALDVYEAGQSDVDFVAVLGRQDTPADFALLRDIHRQVVRADPHFKMDGGYWQAGDLRGGSLPAVARPGYNDGRLSVVPNAALSSVDRWLLARHGVVVFGRQTAQLELAAGWPEVTRYMTRNLETYWLSFTRPSRRQAWLLTDEGVQWAVLGISRLWYAFSEGDIPGKLQAGEYVLERADQRWRPILAEALAVRRGERTRYRSRLARAREAIGFIGYVISIMMSTRR